MKTLLELFIIIPLVGLVVGLIAPRKNEALISWITFLTVGLHAINFIVFFVLWLLVHHPLIDIQAVTLLHREGFDFMVDLYFDKITAVYFFVGSYLTFLITLYSRTYLHRELGYKRFFNTLLFFYLGYNIVIFSGNLETLFIGWEILGISSFLLIAFYRHRYLPVKNAVKVFSIYRIADVGLILAMWMSHHLWHENITFLELSNYQLVHSQLQAHSFLGVFISLMIVVSAAAKSAQLPFSSWLPRAMEGPTPSTAIFYGALSVHIGIFLLLRTYPFWAHQFSVRIFIGLLGLVTSIIAAGIARVQSSVKSQIAYSSVSQIGIIFIEIAAGFHNLALVHFAGNAFLRTYQLLVSPSVVTYKIREQFYNFTKRKLTFEDYLSNKIQYSFYILSLKEWNLDVFMHGLLWNPLKKAGRYLDFLTVNRALFLFIPAYVIGLFCVYHKDLINEEVQNYLPYLFSGIGLIAVLKSFAERKKVRMSWMLVIMNHFWMALAISFNETFDFNQVHLFLSGSVISGIIGYICLQKLRSMEINVDLQQFHGHSYKHPGIALIFLIASLGLIGFPITPTFIGEDLMFSHIKENQVVLAFFAALSFIIDGLAIIRIYARVFLGPHAKSYYEMGYRAS
jgi:NADH-quinone oxidoreductase subunit L